MIGDRIKQARLKLGYSAEQVAAHLGVSPATIYRYENGDIAKLPSKHIVPLAEVPYDPPSECSDNITSGVLLVTHPNTKVTIYHLSM